MESLSCTEHACSLLLSLLSEASLTKRASVLLIAALEEATWLLLAAVHATTSSWLLRLLSHALHAFWFHSLEVLLQDLLIVVALLTLPDLRGLVLWVLLRLVELPRLVVGQSQHVRGGIAKVLVKYTDILEHERLIGSLGKVFLLLL